MAREVKFLMEGHAATQSPDRVTRVDASDNWYAVLMALLGSAIGMFGN